MRQFRNSLFLFISIPLVISVVIFCVTRNYLYNSYLLSTDKTTIIIGDSHTECSLNDSIINNSINISQSSNHYMYAYAKLRRYLSVNPTIDTVVVSYNCYSISSAIDSWYFTDYQLNGRLKPHIFFLNAQEFALVFWNNPKATINAFFKSVEKSAKLIIKSIKGDKVPVGDLDFGGFLYLDRYKLVDDININAESDKVCKINICDLQKEYLLKIKHLCEQESKVLILFDSPLYKKRQYINAGYFSTQDSLRKAEFGNVVYLDYSNFQLPDSCFSDISHLNYKGAEIISEYISKKGFK